MALAVAGRGHFVQVDNVTLNRRQFVLDVNDEDDDDHTDDYIFVDTTLVDDSFTDGGMTDGLDPLDVAWTFAGSNGASASIANHNGTPGIRFGISDTLHNSGRLVADFPEVPLTTVGEYLTISLTVSAIAGQSQFDNTFSWGLVDTDDGGLFTTIPVYPVPIEAEIFQVKVPDEGLPGVFDGRLEHSVPFDAGNRLSVDAWYTATYSLERRGPGRLNVNVTLVDAEGNVVHDHSLKLTGQPTTTFHEILVGGTGHGLIVEMGSPAVSAIVDGAPVAVSLSGWLAEDATTTLDGMTLTIAAARSTGVVNRFATPVSLAVTGDRVQMSTRCACGTTSRAVCKTGSSGGLGLSPSKITRSATMRGSPSTATPSSKAAATRSWPSTTRSCRPTKIRSSSSPRSPATIRSLAPPLMYAGSAADAVITGGAVGGALLYLWSESEE